MEINSQVVQEENKTSLKEDIFDWIESTAISIFAVVLIFTFIFRSINISGSSMNPTLFNEEKVITTKLFYTPDNGDIIVAYSHGLEKTIVKRVIAKENQEVDIDFEKGEVYVDGELQDEPYVAEPTHTFEGVEFPVTVPEGCVFVMGDNRNGSTDSRSTIVGFIDERDIIGKVIFRFYPFNKIGILG